MPMLVQDPAVEQDLIDDRRARGLDRWDEVWDGTYIIMPLPNNEHQLLVARVTRILQELVEDAELGCVFPGCNVSDRGKTWNHNYRCPDVAVFLSGNRAKDHNTHWQGGPDFAIEVISRGDRSHEKVDFYSSIGTRELLLLDRDPWTLTLLQRNGDQLLETTAGEQVVTAIVPLTWQVRQSTDGRPNLTIRHVTSGREWNVSG